MTCSRQFISQRIAGFHWSVPICQGQFNQSEQRFFDVAAVIGEVELAD